jgi:glycosyltransferase involved in cell wall biosynthesis
MARLAVDATAVGPKAKGIGRVAKRTVETLSARGVDVVALVQRAAFDGVPSEVRRARPAVLWEQLGLRQAASRHDVVLTFTERLPVGGSGRFIVWLFELPGHRVEQNKRAGAGPYQRASDLVTTALWRSSLRRAAYVLTGSTATASELRAVAPDLRRVRVCYPGLDERFSPGHGREGRYVLHLASPDPRENSEAVVEAVARANDILREPVRLLIAGGARGRNTDGVEFLGRVSDEELVALYRGASAYVEASLYEGFGYQPLEAMACGAPVVASDIPAVAEVVGGAALLCEPNDQDARAAALVRVLEEPGLADELRANGLERARVFTWERTSSDLASVLDDVAP